ncbi:hypothetical protein L227DRAFT_355563 [Lentinus tigrinus ALCF2SS1-6]|uniref:DUF6697 domain-containing protein n=1 Tax=Lentinus tigrinus ALCF2SS1-6 TaxID=1328759 RepID=A0A5C2RVL3_9APHY|nr:hypothetical protein L227DRAFT_355563 [Lentinus tigrinus ALCF2SS1-6]
MASRSDDEMEKLKSRLQVYEGLLKDQAGEIAALKAEVAYLKQQRQHQSASTSAAVSSAQGLQRSESRPTSNSVVKCEKSPPPPVAGSSQDPFIIDDDDELQVQRSKPVPRRADSDIEPLRDSQDLQQAQATVGPSRFPQSLPKKRRSSPGPGRAFPEYEPPCFTPPPEGDSPRKKPKLVAEVVVPRLSQTRSRAQLARRAPAPAPEIDHNPGPSNTGSDIDDDLSDMSALTSLSSTPSSSPSPLPGESGVDQAQRDVALLLRSASRELSYYDPPVSPSRRATSRPRQSGVANADGNGPTAPVGDNVSSQAGSSRNHDRAKQPRRPPPPPPAPVGSAGTHQRLTELARYNVTLSDPALAHVVVSRKQMSSMYGGSLMRMCVRAAGRDFLFPALDMNPFVPRTAGTPGLLFRSNDALPWKGDVQTVFVGLRQGEYRYCGQYRLRRAEALSAEEYSALSSRIKRKWADGLVNKPKFKDVRVRIATRRDHRREPTFQEIAAVVADRSDPYKGHVSEQEIIAAYERGEERLLVWKMECIGFDEVFLKDLAAGLCDRI